MNQLLDISDERISSRNKADRVIAECAEGFATWSSVSPADRLTQIQSLKTALQRAESSLISIAAKELGASKSWIRLNLDYGNRQIDQLEQLVEPLIKGQPKEFSNSSNHIIRQPVGVVLGVAPWNAPITLALRAILPALMCGNTVVMVSSNYCPQLHARIIDVFREVGFGPDRVGLLEADPNDNQFFTNLISHPSIRRINFTGSSRVGRLIAVEAAKNLKRCILELSGKAPMLVLPGSDDRAVIKAACYGAFFNQGQICMSTERLIIVNHQDPETFNARLAEHIKEITAIKGADLGTIVNSEAAKRIRDLIHDAQEKGAQLMAGGAQHGTFIEPTLITNVTPEMRLYREEIFGPILSIRHVSSVEEAIFFANDSEFGLSASVFSPDLESAKEVANQLESGIVQINGPTLHDDPSFPFGGMKASGYGRFGGTSVIEEFTELRWYGVHKPSASPSL
jgi:acyl-CoA reductase-like NAD-dependent aldehyde dehydrogenase